MTTIPLSKGFVAIVDSLNGLDKFSWYITSYGYARCDTKDARTGKRVRMAMHRLIMAAKPGEIVDHINGNRLDNRRSNLRLVTRTQSNQNKSASRRSRSGFKGVYWTPLSKINPWFARIEANGIVKSLGSYPTKEAAAKAYNDAAVIQYGPYARLNEL